MNNEIVINIEEVRKYASYINNQVNTPIYHVSEIRESFGIDTRGKVKDAILRIINEETKSCVINTKDLFRYTSKFFENAATIFEEQDSDVSNSINDGNSIGITTGNTKQTIASGNYATVNASNATYYYAWGVDADQNINGGCGVYAFSAVMANLGITYNGHIVTPMDYYNVNGGAYRQANTAEKFGCREHREELSYKSNEEKINRK